MCIIVDANTCHKFANGQNNEAAPIIDWLKNRRGQLVYGGKLRREVLKTSFRRVYLQMKSAGWLHEEDDTTIDLEENRIEDECDIKSDDAHVLALAIVSGARVLFTRDHALACDFKNRSLLPAPRGRIYSGERNAAMLKTYRCNCG